MATATAITPLNAIIIEKKEMMRKFRKLGFINYNSGGMRVHSSLLNVVLHDQ